MVAAAPASAQIWTDGDAACTAGSPAVRVNVTGLKDRSGRLKLELYPATEDDFLKDDRDLKKEGKFFARIWSPTPKSGPVTLCIRAPRPGRYALLFTHDRDGKNKFNFWKDGAGFASNRNLGRSRPKLNEAVITVGATGATVSIRAQYLRGLSGFAPYDGN
ncbi:DUF2141 domain-containing protein [Sphingomonas sp.]|uniref:DUF2141 domain-containing protein n=1 Tax=Sphingomonas sp. TaxID=28214 RepID=UPI001EC78F77|nr:DUF2141 domain-containing protein [Sphingomonas sp.]MBX3593747.1 DUF2141 domain-containing protein [Sphingomonas sp.]